MNLSKIIELQNIRHIIIYLVDNTMIYFEFTHLNFSEVVSASSEQAEAAE